MARVLSLVGSKPSAYVLSSKPSAYVLRPKPSVSVADGSAMQLFERELQAGQSMGLLLSLTYPAGFTVVSA